MDMLDAALNYAKKGWYVFPVRERTGEMYVNKLGKEIIPKPKFPYTKSGILDATINPEQIKKWWKFKPDAAIGVNCGMSGLFVIDVDNHAVNGMENFATLGIDTAGALHAKTGGGGLHIIFSGKGKSSSNRNMGIDTRSEGGYIIVPPSVIYADDGTLKTYIQLDDWNRTPIQISETSMEKILPKFEKKERNDSVEFTNNDENFQKIRRLLLEQTRPDRADDYYNWVTAGYVLKHTFGEKGFSVWNDWSKKSDKYDESSIERIWDLLKPNGGSTIGTLFYWRKVDKNYVK